MHSEADSLLYLGMKQPLNLTSGSIKEPPNPGWSLEPSTNLTLDHNGKLNSQILMQALIWEGEVIGVWLGEGLDIGREQCSCCIEFKDQAPPFAEQTHGS